MKTAKAMTELRASMVAAEQSRAAVAALLKAGSRGGEAVAARIVSLVKDQIKALEHAHAAVGVSLKASVAVVTPAPLEPEQKPTK